MKVVVFGAGYWGKNYVRELAGNLVAVVEPDKERAAYVAQTFNVPVYAEAPDIDYDASIIVTPPEHHIKLAYQEVQKGKLILLEKPFATCVEEYLHLRNYRKQVMCGLIYLYNPGIIQLKKVLETTPLHHCFSRRTNNGPVREWQSVLWDLASHDIAIFNYMFGQAPYSAERMGDRDWTVLNLFYPTVNAVIYVSWHGGPKHRKIELVPADSEERIIFDDVTTVWEQTPLRLMLDDFLSGEWDDKAGFDAGINVVSVLDSLS